MEPFLSAEMEGSEAKERKKIQFSVPSALPTQLDPRQVEMIRRRRPTPATLFRLTDQPSPEEELCSLQVAAGENGVLKSKRQNIAVYQPPSLKAVQSMAQAHMQKLEGTPEGSDSEDCSLIGLDSDGDFLEDCGSDQSAHLMRSEVTAEELPNILQTEPPEDEDGEEDEELEDSRAGERGQD